MIQVQNGKPLHWRLAQEEEISVSVHEDAVHNKGKECRRKKQLQIAEVGLEGEIDLLDRYEIQTVEARRARPYTPILEATWDRCPRWE